MTVYVTENKSVNIRKPEIQTAKFDDAIATVNTKFNIPALTDMLLQFNQTHAALFQAKRADLYQTFHIPKSSGGLRRIDAPSPEISEALKNLRIMFESHFVPYAHNSAYAYVRNRSTVDAVKRHQENQSRWFLKLDFSNFFGNSTYEFVVYSLSQIYPFNEIIKQKDGKLALEQALELCFLNGSLPQGSPISPYLTNIMMIPIDCEIDETLKRMNKSGRQFVYTRYADDMLISCTEGFDIARLEADLNRILIRHRAPFAINPKKTRYGSNAGKNWNLGVMLNKDNKITIGHQKKRQFKAMLDNYIRSHDNWDLHDVQILSGLKNYYNMVEPDYISHTITAFNAKYQVNINQMMHDDLSLMGKIDSCFMLDAAVLC